MAFLQSDLPPSTAPVSLRPTVRSAGPALPVRKSHAALVVKLLAGLIALAVLVILGIAAAKATESFAVGILAADLAFLIAVAGWSSVAGGSRR